MEAPPAAAAIPALHSPATSPLDSPATSPPNSPATARPCVSVLMPCRNAGRFLEEAIESVLADPTVLELLIADGGSGDGSLERIERRCRGERRLRLVSRTDHGPADALNRAWPQARGTVIGWLNADDRYTPGAPGRAVAALAAQPQWLMVYGEGEHIDAMGRPLERYPTRGPQVGLAGFRDYCFICQPTVFWRRTLTLLVGPWNPSLRCAFDFEYWLRAFQAVPHRIGHLPELQAQSRVHGATLSATQAGVAVLEATRLQITHLPNPSPHILLAYALEVLEGTTPPPAGSDPKGHLAALLQELRPHLGEPLWQAVLEQLPALGPHLAG